MGHRNGAGAVLAGSSVLTPAPSYGEVMKKPDEQLDDAAFASEAGMEWLEEAPSGCNEERAPSPSQRAPTVAISHRDVIYAWEHYEKAR
jgi:hypothetical protein